MNTAIIVAGGKGRRVGADVNKVFLDLGGKEIICHTLDSFDSSGFIDNIILVTSPDDKDKMKEIITRETFKKVIDIVDGGKHRQDSVYNGVMKAIEISNEDAKENFIVVHNAANPLVSQDDIAQAVISARNTGASASAHQVTDTIKMVKNDHVDQSLERDFLWAMQTPQVMRMDLAQEAFESAKKEGFIGTDSTMLIERLGHRVRIIPTSIENFKITTEKDLEIARMMLRARERRCSE